jgi:alpha-L-fucosidase
MTYVLVAVCFVLLITNAASADWITAKVADVSSQNPVPNRDASHSVDGSGLTDNGKKHLRGETGIAWTSLGMYGAKDFDPYIVYDLGAAKDVSMIRVWNYNSAFVIKAPAVTKEKSSQELSTLNKSAGGITLSVVGPDLVEVFTSVDGKKFTSRKTVNFARAPGTNDYAGQDIAVNYKGVRYIKFDIKTNHDGAVFDGSGSKRGKIDGRGLTGLSEVRFKVPGMVEVRQSGGSTVVHEGGKGDRYDIRLLKRPEPGVTVNIKAVPSDAQVKLNKADAGIAVDVSFNRKNWNKWKKITVKAKDDQVVDPGHESSIRHIVTISGSSVYNNCQAEDIDVSIVEDDKIDAVSDAKLEPIDPEKRMEWFRDIKYYWFIHWNVASLTGREISWSRNVQVPKSEYDQLYKKFNPSEFDADEWVRIAKAAGFKTMVLTTKHHDGFCMWDTKQTDYNIMNTPFGRDVVKELAEACKRQNFRFSLYYSIMDFYQPDWPHYYAGGPGYSLPAGQKPDINRYLKYMNNQVTELLGGDYGEISLLWWDGTDGRMQFAPDRTDEQSAELENLTRELQPAIVMNNRVGHWDGHSIAHNWWIDKFGDYDSSEMGLGHFNMETPWEYTFNLGDQWSWKPNDNYKSTKTMVQYMVNIAGRDGNLLLNIGPPPTGKFEDHVVERLEDIGHWLKHNGESYYATRGGPYKPGSWGASTRKDNKIYLHVLNWAGEKLVLPAIDKKITGCSVLTGGEVDVRQTKDNVIIDVPEYYRRDVDTIVVLELDGPAIEIEPIDTF